TSTATGGAQTTTAPAAVWTTASAVTSMRPPSRCTTKGTSADVPGAGESAPSPVSASPLVTLDTQSPGARPLTWTRAVAVDTASTEEGRGSVDGRPGVPTAVTPRTCWAVAPPAEVSRATSS